MNDSLELDSRCMDCLLRVFDRLMVKYPLIYENRQAFFEKYNLLMGRSIGMTTPQIHRELNREFCRLIGVDDPYLQEKKESNRLAMSLYNELRMDVLNAENPFNMALRLSIAGNIMDYGASGNFDIHQTIKKVLETDFSIDKSAELRQALKTARHVLYIGDNAGEIVFDKLFIEIIMHQHLTYAVRGSAVLNDATMDDALQVDMISVADVISTGYDAPSVIPEKCSPDFMSAYRRADLIIAKGQGNLEGLISQNDPRIFHLLMVKCPVVSELLQVPEGGFVVFNQQAI